MAKDLLDRFFRDAEGKTNRQIDVYFALEDMGVQRDRAEEGLEYLTSRGLVNMFGPDVAFLTELGVSAATEDKDISKMVKQARDFAQVKPPVAVKPTRNAEQASAPKAPAVEVPIIEAPVVSLPPHSQRPQLRFSDPDGSERVVELGWTCTIGRVEGNTIHLQDQRASKKHAEVKFENNSFVLNDLGAANGTLVNGSYIDAHPLKHGDQIVIGRTTLTFEAPRVITAPPADRAETPAMRPPEPAPAPIVVQTERPQPSERASQEIRVVKGRPDSGRSSRETMPPPRRPAQQPPPEDDLFASPRQSERARVPPFPGPASRPMDDPDDLFAQPVRENRASSDLFDGDTAPRPALQGGGDLFADDAPRQHQPSAHDLFSEAAIVRPAPEAPSNLFDEEPNTVFARSEHRHVLDEIPIEAPDTMEPLAAVDPLEPMDPIDQLDPIEHLEPIESLDPIDHIEELEIKAPSHDLGSESTLVNASLADLQAAANDAQVEEVEPWSDHDAHTPADEQLVVEPPTESHPRDDRLDNAPVAHAIDTRDFDEQEISRDAAARARARNVPAERAETVLAPGGMALGMEAEADTEGATPPSSRPGLREPMVRDASEDLPMWGEDDKRPVGSHPAFAQGSAQHIAEMEREEPGEDLPEANPELADLSLSGLPIPAGVETAPPLGRESVFHRTLRALRVHVERADLPDRDRVLAAIDLLERHPYVRVALNLSEPDR